MRKKTFFINVTLGEKLKTKNMAPVVKKVTDPCRTFVTQSGRAYSVRLYNRESRIRRLFVRLPK